MKKKIIIILISFFIFCPNCFALSKVNSMNVNVHIDEAGNALVEETWQLNSQNNHAFEKSFIETKDVTIKDISLTDSNNINYELVKKYDKDDNFIYCIQEKKNTQSIKFNTNGKATTVTLKYTVEGMIKSFDDFNALDWYFLNLGVNQEIGTLNIYIFGPVSFNENNTALYAIGDNLSANISDGYIHLFASNIANKTKIHLLASFTDLTFNNTIKEEGLFLDYYNEIVNESPIIREIKEVLHSVVFIVIVVIIGILLIIFFIYRVIKNKSEYNDYKNIISYNKEREVGDLNSTPYQDMIPCDANIYKIYFYANYYNIIKHRSSLLGTIMFKWILDGVLRLEEVDNKKIIVIEDGKTFTNELDTELYNILKASSNNLILDNNKLIRYCATQNEILINWYYKVVRTSIIEEYNKRNINIKGKKILLNKVIYNDALNIQGLKRYLLNFNQVPRRTELTEEVYEYSLALSILLGVDDNLSQEILRKNPDNELAKKLQEFQKAKYLYKNIYSTSYEEYKKNKKHKDKNVYLPKKD